MKVEVVQSLTLSRIFVGMQGETSCHPAMWDHGAPNFLVEVKFKDVPSSVPGDSHVGDVIVMMQKQELKLIP